jgi:hypothetical protein
VSPAGAGCREPSRHASRPSGLPSITPAAFGLRAPLAFEGYQGLPGLDAPMTTLSAGLMPRR